MQTRLLVDADILLYSHSMACMETNLIHSEYYKCEILHQYARLDKAKLEFAASIEGLVRTLSADRTILVLTDNFQNFRKGIMAEYKGQRTADRPLAYYRLREWVVEQYHTECWPTLEGDDVLGILTSQTHKEGWQTVCASLDKDMKTVPGEHYNWRTGLRFNVDEAGAARNHLYQTLVGDTVDNYKGCKGVGPVKATKILDTDCTWAAVVAAYEKAEMTEADALRNAQVAYILQHGDYDRDTQAVTLWQPPVGE
jgi:DNA polymerase-1